MNKPRIRELLLYEFRKGSTTTEAFNNICQTEGEKAVSYSTVKDWFKKFREGDEGLKDQPRSGRPISINSEALTQAIQDHPSSSTRQLGAHFNVDKQTIANHLHQQGFVNKECAEVPHMLTTQQKEHRVAITTDLLARFEAGMRLSSIITCDEKWVYLDNRCVERQWLKPGESGEHVARKIQHAAKVLLCVWWCSSGSIHFELLPNGATINAELYQQQLQRVQHSIQGPPFSTNFRSGVLLIHDNARPHVANATLQKIHELGWLPLLHPPYSPDISPCDYYLFRSLEHFLRGKQFISSDNVQKERSEERRVGKECW